MGFTDKHIINSAGDLVVDSLEGLCALNPQLALDVQNRVVYQKSQDRTKVALICGGGSGHEPAHAGFVGKGMLTAAICGNVFASPNASQVKRGISLVDNPNGTLIIVKNYTGDILCFGLSKEQYLASQPAEKHNLVRFVVVGDDVAVGKTQGSIVGRRGLAGTVLVYKIAGALAAHGAPLDEVGNVAEWVASRLATIGCGLEHCHVPGTGKGEPSLKADEIEIGLGIHNEPGVQTVSPVPARKDLMSKLVDILTSMTDEDRSFLPFIGNGDEVVLMVNNLGGLSELELGGIAREALAVLTSRGIVVQRLLVGTFMTSLNMPGFSLTLLLLPHTSETTPKSNRQILSLLGADVDVPGWKWSVPAVPSIVASATISDEPRDALAPSGNLRDSNPNAFDQVIQKACNNLISGEQELTRLDSISGDGDCGLTLKGGAEAVLDEMRRGNVSGDDVTRAILQISRIAEERMGGTSGALYSIFFSALAQALPSTTGQMGGSVLDAKGWIRTLNHSLNTLYTYTRARPPSRTLVDPVAAFIGSLNNGDSITTAVQKATDAAEQTASIQAKAGRSAYVEEKHLKGVADPGAMGVKMVLEALV